jgi:hypothetical protein
MSGLTLEVQKGLSAPTLTNATGCNAPGLKTTNQPKKGAVEHDVTLEKSGLPLLTAGDTDVRVFVV